MGPDDLHDLRRKRQRLLTGAEEATEPNSSTIQHGAIIDLTGDSPEPANKHQNGAFDALFLDQAARVKPQIMKGMVDDEMFARQLQDQFDRESLPATEASNFVPNEHSIPSVKFTALGAEEVQATVRNFAQPISETKCENCGKMLLKECDIHSFAEFLLTGADLEELSCASCETVPHIPELRTVMIWILLCSFDTRSKYNTPEVSKKKKKKAKTSKPGPGKKLVFVTSPLPY
jgi:hypothetical protein